MHSSRREFLAAFHQQRFAILLPFPNWPAASRSLRPGCDDSPPTNRQIVQIRIARPCGNGNCVSASDAPTRNRLLQIQYSKSLNPIESHWITIHHLNYSSAITIPIEIMESNKSAIGVYKNPRLMHVSTTVVGSTVQLQTKDGSVWEGIFATFSPAFAICLELTVQIDPKLKSQDGLFHALKNGSKAKEKAFFDLKDIVRITVNDIDLNYVTKEMDKIVTDSDISGFNPTKAGEHRELESWQDDDDDGNNAEETLLSLDEVANLNKNGGQNNRKPGWAPQDMFRYNERRHKVISTYNDNLHDYTIALPKPGRHDRDWRKKQDRAAALAREIESNPKSQVRLAKEDGSDNEEEKFSAVVRPSPSVQPTQSPQASQSTQSHQSAQLNQSGQQTQTNQAPQPSQQAQPTQQTQPTPQTQSPQATQSPQSTQSPQATQSTQPTPPPESSSSSSPQQTQHQASSSPPLQSSMPPMPRRTFRPRYNPRTDSLKDFSRKLTIAPKQPEDQSELVKKSKLNPNAKEFVYKPRSPASAQGAQANGANQSVVGLAPTVDLTNSSPMNQTAHGPYYQQVPIFSHPPTHQQQPHYPTQFMPNYPHMHFQSHIQYMPSPMAPHFSPQQVSPRYIRGNFQNYHHRYGEHVNTSRAYPPTSMAVPTSSSGQPYVPPSSSQPQHPNTYAMNSPQQPMVYGAPPQPVYPMAPPHMSQVPNPHLYEGYIPPTQNYVINQ